MLKVYPRYEPKVIVDVTYGKGIFYRKNGLQVIGFDMDPTRAKDAVASYECLPLKTSSVDVLIFDPPHLVKSGTKGVIKKLYNEFAVGSNHLANFFAEAERVLKPEGLIFTKTCDYINSGTYNWQLMDIIGLLRDRGLCPCDLIVKVRPSALRHPAWTCQLHARKRHSFWIVGRKSRKC